MLASCINHRIVGLFGLLHAYAQILAALAHAPLSHTLAYAREFDSHTSVACWLRWPIFNVGGVYLIVVFGLLAALAYAPMLTALAYARHLIHKPLWPVGCVGLRTDVA